MKRLIFIGGLTVTVFFSMPSFGQVDLVLIKKNSIITTIGEGEYIRFKRKDRDHFNAGIIEGIRPDYFRIGEDTTYLHQVEGVDMRGRPNTGFKTQAIGAVFIAAGVVLFVGDLIAVTAVQGQSYEPDRGVIITSVVLVGSGIAMQFVNNNIFKIGRKKKITTWKKQK